jgi:hypothetical protein
MQTEIEKVFNRKKELIHRDPLFDELSETFKKGIAIGIHRRQDGSLFDDADIMTPLRPMREGFDPSETKRNRDQNLLFLKLIKLGNNLQDKWRVFIKFFFSLEQISVEAPYIEEKIFVGNPFLQTKKGSSYLKTSANRNAKPLYHWLPYPNSFRENPRLNCFDDFMMLCKKSTEGQNWLPIIVNTSRLNKSDAKTIKKQIWSVIEANLQKEAKKKPWEENKECSFLYSIRQEKTFQNYLRWYDIHTQEKISFRLIAKIEEMRSENIGNAERFLEKVRNMRMKVGHPIRGEDRIARGVKLIWSAIHREPYTSAKVEPVIEEWNCPEHGKNYSKKCEHCKGLMDRFNRIYSMSRGYKPTIDPNTLDSIFLKRTGKLPRKITSSIEEE